LTNPKEYSVSIITPPKITKATLAEAKELGIESVWLQPGTYDDEILAYVKKEFKGGVGGYEGGTVGGEGWCVLVDGEEGMRAAGRTGKL
jgi:CoA binding domain